MGKLLEHLERVRSLGVQITAFQADRFAEETTNSNTVLESTPTPELREPPYDKVTRLIIELQKKARKDSGDLILTGGWASLFLSYPLNLRSRSFDVDFFTDPLTALLLVEPLNLQQVGNWGCWVSNHFVGRGVSVRVEVNVGDVDWPYINIRPPREVLKTKDIIMIAKPLYVIGGKLVRTLYKGPQEKDQIDVGSILLGSYMGDGDIAELRRELNQDERAKKAFESLNLPYSIGDKLSACQFEKLSERVRFLFS